MTSSSDHVFGLWLAWTALVIGLGAALAWPSRALRTTHRPAVGRTATEIDEAPVGHRGEELTAPALEIPANERVRDEWRRKLRLPEGRSLQDWEGVFIETVLDSRDVRAILNEFDARGDLVEGPPFHFLVDADGFHVTERWRRQASWRIDALDEPERWIVVRVTTAAPADDFIDHLWEMTGRRAHRNSDGAMATEVWKGSRR